MTTIAKLTATLIVALFTAMPANAELIKKASPVDVAATLDNLEKVLASKGLTIFARIDHTAGADKVGLELRPTQVLIFGNPQVGTKLMQAEQTMGLTLPLKALAWQDAEGKTWLGYDAPATLAVARGLPADHPVIVKVTGALDKLTGAALKASKRGSAARGSD